MSRYLDTSNGGPWLGACRSWLQWNTTNGCRVTWGSDDLIEPRLSFKDVERMAAKVAEVQDQDTAKHLEDSLETMHKLLTAILDAEDDTAIKSAMDNAAWHMRSSAGDYASWVQRHEKKDGEG